MNNDLEVSFSMTKEEIERLKKILLGASGVRHFLLRLADGTEVDVVNYESYKKLEEELNDHSKRLCEAVNYDVINILIKVKDGILKFYVENGYIYCENTMTKERVIVGEEKDE